MFYTMFSDFHQGTHKKKCFLRRYCFPVRAAFDNLWVTTLGSNDPLGGGCHLKLSENRNIYIITHNGSKVRVMR